MSAGDTRMVATVTSLSLHHKVHPAEERNIKRGSNVILCIILFAPTAIFRNVLKGGERAGFTKRTGSD